MTFLALAIGMGASEPGQRLIRLIVESHPDIRLVDGVPLILIVCVVVMAIVVDLLGGVIFDFDVNTGYRNVFRKLDEMVAEMEELRGCDGFGGGQNQLHLGVREAIVTSSRVAAPT